jgi:ATP-dependent protease HslVU (ClpYQ) peptidase subunit
MTTIAYDGRTLAADKQNSVCGIRDCVTKVFRVPGGMVAFAGSSLHAMRLLDWFRRNQPRDLWPKPKNDDQCADALFVSTSGEILFFSGESSVPTPSESPFVALGSGRDFALAAMHLGHDARKAVEIACALDINSGCGIDAIERGA